MKKISKMYHTTQIFLYMSVNMFIIKLLCDYNFDKNAV